MKSAYENFVNLDSLTVKSEEENPPTKALEMFWNVEFYVKIEILFR